MPTGSRHKLTSQYGIDSFKDEIICSNNHSKNCDSEDFDLLYAVPATMMVTDKTHETSEDKLI